MTPQEYKDWIYPITEQIYISYYDYLICPDTDHLIQEYKDRRALVHIDDEGKSTFIKLIV